MLLPLSWSAPLGIAFRLSLSKGLHWSTGFGNDLLLFSGRQVEPLLLEDLVDLQLALSLVLDFNRTPRILKFGLVKLSPASHLSLLVILRLSLGLLLIFSLLRCTLCLCEFLFELSAFDSIRVHEVPECPELIALFFIALPVLCGLVPVLLQLFVS